MTSAQVFVSVSRILGTEDQDDLRDLLDRSPHADSRWEQARPRRDRIPATQLHEHADSHLDARMRVQGVSECQATTLV